MTRRESGERQEAVLQFFLDNPRATGEEAQTQLTLGRLVPSHGKDQPPMGLHMLFRIKRRAEEITKRGGLQANEPALHFPPTSHSNGADSKNEDQMNALRERTREVQELLVKMPPGVLEVHVSRGGIKILRTTEEEL